MKNEVPKPNNEDLVKRHRQSYSLAVNCSVADNLSITHVPTDEAQMNTVNAAKLDRVIPNKKPVSLINPPFPRD